MLLNVWQRAAAAVLQAKRTIQLLQVLLQGLRLLLLLLRRSLLLSLLLHGAAAIQLRRFWAEAREQGGLLGGGRGVP
jgi:hypothetical protein